MAVVVMKVEVFRGGCMVMVVVMELVVLAVDAW